MKDLIFLMGMPGSGKSTFGKKLAAKLKCPFLDLDNYIENKTNLSVAELFSQKGEHYFRDLETSCLTEIISAQNKLVLSLGGGTPCYNNNIELIKQSGTSIYLDAPVKLLADRIMSSENVRPMFKHLTKDETLIKLEELKKNRELFYQQSAYKFNVVDLTINEVITTITGSN
jgi:shikimate kinase